MHRSSTDAECTTKAAFPAAITNATTFYAMWEQKVVKVKYAVSIYDIQHDTDDQGNTVGLTFGPATGESYVNSYKSHTPNWFQANTVLTYENENFQCCHAGLDSEDIAENLPEVLMLDRTRIDRNDYYGKLTIIGHTPIEDATWYAGDEKTTEILPERKRMQLPKTGLICLDTGCVFGYRLTAMVIEGEKYWLDSVFSGKDDEE